MPRRSSHPPGRLGRRRWIQGGLGSAGALTLGSGCAASTEQPEHEGCALHPAPEPVYGSPSARTEALASAFLDVPIDGVFALCTQRLQDHTPDELLAALLVAGARSIPPDSGDGLHATLSIHAALHLHRQLPGPEGLVPIYYASRALKFRQAGDGQLGPMPTLIERTPEDALRRFDDAMAALDPEAADTAVLELFASAPTPVAIERLIRWSTREQGAIGHLMIWFGLAIRSLDSLGWQHAPDVLRSVVRDATARSPGFLSPLHDEHLARLQSIAAPIGPCKTDEGLTRELVAELRLKEPVAAAAYVLGLLEASAPTAATWDGFAVSATEDLIRGGEGFALHRFDGMNALHHLCLRSADPLTQQLVMVQTAAYMCLFQARQGADVLTVEPQPIAAIDEIFDGVALGPLTAAERVLGHLASGGTVQPVHARAQALTVQMAHRVDEHSYKFPVAVIEETQLASDPWKPLVLAAIGGQQGRSPSTVGPQWQHYDEVLAEIDSL